MPLPDSICRRARSFLFYATPDRKDNRIYQFVKPDNPTSFEKENHFHVPLFVPYARAIKTDKRKGKVFYDDQKTINRQSLHQW